MFSRIATLILCAVVAATAASPTASAQTRNKKKTSTSKAPAAKAPAGKKSSVKAKTASKKTAAKKTAKPKMTAKQIAKARRMKAAFVASAELKPMARQLVENRSAAAYAAVEKYAKQHKSTSEGALAWLAIGYARTLDDQHPEAIQALKLAQAKAGDLSDYVTLLLAKEYSATGQHPLVIETLKNFEAENQDSLLTREATLLYAQTLVGQKQPEQAVEALLKARTPKRAEVELALGDAYSAAGAPADALDAYRNVYYDFPLSAQAEIAERALKAFQASPVSFARRKARADALLNGRRASQAVAEYRELLSDATDADRDSVRHQLGVALYRANQQSDARKIFEELPVTQDERGAQRLYFLTEIARSKDDKDKVADLLGQLRSIAPQNSQALADALQTAGNMYLLKDEPETAARFYIELANRVPTASNAPFSHWRGAWLVYRAGKKDEAKQLFEAQIRKFPNSAEAANALYWRGRLAEDDGDAGLARSYYTKLRQRYQHFYYASVVQERIADLGGVTPKHDPVIDSIPPVSRPAIAEAVAPEDNVRLAKSRLLANGGLYDFAMRELQPLADEKHLWAVRELIGLYQDQGNYFKALQAAKRSVPSYFAQNMDALPEPIWQALFPRPYWESLRGSAQENGLDPILIASLIRQESEFNPGAVSRANAIGLMQLLPDTAKKVAKSVKLRGFSTGQLTDPYVNLKLGTRYFAEMVKKFDGEVAYALAAYNAGPNRVDDWRSKGNYRDIYEWVESIPFTETRGYVQSIMRNANVYRRIYGRSHAETAMR